jgi:hypothetical protein
MADKGLTFQKYGKRSVTRIFPITKKQVEEGDTDSVKDMIDSAVKELKEVGVIHPWDMVISGYGVDPRPLAQIPETEIWFRRAQGAYPYLPIFLSPFILTNYLYSQFYNIKIITTHKKQDLSVVQSNEIDKLVAALNEFQPCLGDECRKQLEYRVEYKVDLNDTQRLYANIKFAARTYLSLNEIPRPVSEKAIVQAFVRINQALEN